MVYDGKPVNKILFIHRCDARCKSYMLEANDVIVDCKQKVKEIFANSANLELKL